MSLPQSFRPHYSPDWELFSLLKLSMGLVLLSLFTVNVAGAELTFATLAGESLVAGLVDGSGSTARFNNPTGVAVDSSGNVYLADQYNCTIRKITSGGAVTTLAGMAGSPGSTDGAGSAARFNFPIGVAVDAAGNVYVADRANHTIRKITSSGVVTTLAGNVGNPGMTNGTGSAARFAFPTGVTVDSSGNVYVADRENHAIRKITSGGVVSTLAGLAGSLGSTDGTGSDARFYFPTGVSADDTGNIFVADQSNGTIRRITSDGVVTTVAGMAGSLGSSDGTGSTARFFYPTGVAVDGTGNVYVADRENHTVRKMTSAGVVTTVAGIAGSPGIANGTGNIARFSYPFSVAADHFGNLYVADTLGQTIRWGAVVLITGQPASQTTTRGSNVVLATLAMSGEALTYQWQVWHEGDSDWHDVSDGGRFNGSQTAALLITQVTTIIDDGDRYRVVISYAGGAVTSATSTLMVDALERDFNGDGKSDLLWSNTNNGDYYFWLMNGTRISQSIFLGTIPPVWSLATGDFNGDGKPDLLWSNTDNGDRYFWLMDGTGFSQSVFLGTIPQVWRVSTGDFNGDGKTDLLWSNTDSGDRYIWLMNGTNVSNSVFLGTVSPVWTVSTGNFNADGNTDLLWSNTSNGDRYFWLMNGTSISSSVFLATVAPEWSVGN